MKNKTKLLAVISFALLVLIGTFIFNFDKTDTNVAEEAFKSGKINTSFSEEYASDEQLKELSNIIITGTVTKLKEKSIKSIKTSNNNKSLTVEVPVSLYDIDVTEKIKGEAAPKKIGIAITDTDVNLDIGKQYTLILYKIPGDSELSAYYGLVSYSQGFYELNEETQELIPIKEKSNTASEKDIKKDTNKNISYSEFKKRFK